MIGNNSSQMKERFLKHKPIRINIKTREIPTVTTRSERMRPAFETLPMGSPWACTFMSGWMVSNSSCVCFSILANLLADFESKDWKAGAR